MGRPPRQARFHDFFTYRAPYYFLLVLAQSGLRFAVDISCCRFVFPVDLTGSGYLKRAETTYLLVQAFIPFM